MGPSRTTILMLSCGRERRSHFFTLTRKCSEKTPQTGRLGSLWDTISTFCRFPGPPILSLFFRRRPGAVQTPWGSGVPDYAQIWPCSHIYRYTSVDRAYPCKEQSRAEYSGSQHSVTKTSFFEQRSRTARSKLCVLSIWSIQTCVFFHVLRR